MTQIIVDTATAERLRASGSDVVLCDPDGVSLGRFRSEEVARAYAEAARLFSDEELDRADGDQTTFTTEEVIRNLESGNV